MLDYSAFISIIKKYAQDQSTNPNPNLNPDELQVGQSIYNDVGDEFIVLEDKDTTTNKVIAPKDQLNVGSIPQGVQTVEDSQLSTGYSVQPKDGTVTSGTLPCLREFLNTNTRGVSARNKGRASMGFGDTSRKVSVIRNPKEVNKHGSIFHEFVKMAQMEDIEGDINREIDRTGVIIEVGPTEDPMTMYIEYPLKGVMNKAYANGEQLLQFMTSVKDGITEEDFAGQVQNSGVFQFEDESYYAGQEPVEQMEIGVVGNRIGQAGLEDSAADSIQDIFEDGFEIRQKLKSAFEKFDKALYEFDEDKNSLEFLSVLEDVASIVDGLSDSFTRIIELTDDLVEMDKQLGVI